MTLPSAVKEICSRIQHTVVSPGATEDDIVQACRDCVRYGFDGVMIMPCWVPEARKLLAGTKVKVCTAFGFPMGGSSVLSKVMEMRDIVASGADEIDFMPNFGLFKSGRYDQFRAEIADIVRAAEGRATKVMLEFGMLDEREKKLAAELALDAGVTYLKNSSGWGQGGHAAAEDIRLLRRVAGERAKVKASGGIRNYESALNMLEAGADLIGTSGSVRIATGGEAESGQY